MKLIWIKKNDYLAVATHNSCKIWKIKDKSVIKRFNQTGLFKNKKILFKGCKFSRDGSYLYIGKIAPGMRSWLEKWKYNQSNNSWILSKNTISHRNYHHNCIELSYDDKFIATGTLQGTVAVFNSSNLHKIMEIKAHDFFITRICFSPDNKALYSVSADYSCKLNKIQQNTGYLNGNILLILLLLLFSVVMYWFMGDLLPFKL